MKKIFIAVGMLLALVVVAGLVILIPPHLQIRRMEPTLPSLATVQSLRATATGPISVTAVQLGTQQFQGRLSGNAVFVIEWSDGRAFMIDAGMDKGAAIDFSNQAKMFGATGELEYRGSIAQLLGDKISNVQGVAFTHLHIDHTQGVNVFCSKRGTGAKVFQTAAQSSIHNLHTKEGAAIVRDSCLQQVTVEGDGIISVPGFPGLWMMNVGGHTPCSTIFFARVGEKLWLLSGDVANNKQDLLENRAKGFVYSYLLVPEDTRQLEKLRAWLAGLDARDDIEVIVSHDASALDQSSILKAN